MKTRKFTDEQLINAVAQNQNITQPQLAEILNCSVSAVSNNIRRIVQEGLLVQKADNNGVYHYEVPEQKRPVTVHTIQKVVEIPLEVPVDQTKIWINEIKADLKRDLDVKVRDFLNKQYKRMIGELTAELGL